MITKFSQFKETYKPINEGGGAGIQFEMKFDNQNAILTIHNGKIQYDNTIVNADEYTITGEGYDDGGTFTGQLEVSDQIPTNMNKIIEMLKHVTISDLIYSYGKDEVFKSFQFAKDMNTHTSIYEYSFKESVDINVELDFLYEEMKFGGWMRGNLEVGDTMFTGEDIYTNEYSRIYFNDCEFVSSVKEKPQNKIAFDDLYSLFVPNIIISEELASWYDSVFINPETDEDWDEDWDEEFESKN